MARKSIAKRPLIAIAGNIGAGKTTLVGLLEKRYSCQVISEPVADNPFLAKFYTSPERWAFPCQIAFLSDRFAQQRDLAGHTSEQRETPFLFTVQDRSLLEDCEIFATHLWHSKLLSDDEWQTYKRLYDQIIQNVRLPNRIIYLRTSVENLIRRIKYRDRSYERLIDPTYLHRLNILYEGWISKLGPEIVSVIDTDDIDLARSERDQRHVIDQLQLGRES